MPTATPKVNPVPVDCPSELDGRILNQVQDDHYHQDDVMSHMGVSQPGVQPRKTSENERVHSHKRHTDRSVLPHPARCDGRCLLAPP